MSISCFGFWSDNQVRCLKLCQPDEALCPFITERGLTGIYRKENSVDEKCQNCFEPLGDYRYTVYNHDNDEIEICKDCYNTKFGRCSFCDGKYSLEDLDNNDLCPDCNENTFICSCCDERYDNNDYGEDGYCQGCWDEREDRDREDGLYEYHDYPQSDWKFKALPIEQEPTLFFGVELETDNFDNRSNCVDKLTREFKNLEDICYPSEDSSLDHGIEFVCHPATLLYHQTEFPWKKLTSIISSTGGKSHQTGTCGLHIHFSKAFFGENKTLNDLNQLKTIFLINHFWEEMSVLARRKSTFAMTYPHSVFDKLPPEKVHDLTRGADGYGGHYNAVNILPTKTIELRLFKGTLKYETIIASIELTDYLVHFVNDNPVKRLKTLSWNHFIVGAEAGQYKFLPDYLKSHNLHSESNGTIQIIWGSD